MIDWGELLKASPFFCPFLNLIFPLVKFWKHILLLAPILKEKRTKMKKGLKKFESKKVKLTKVKGGSLNDFQKPDKVIMIQSDDYRG